MTATLKLKHGDTWSARFTYTDAAGDAIDLTDCDARLALRDRLTDEEVLAVSDSTGELTIDGANGIVDLLVDYTTMAAIDAGTYVSDLELTYPSGLRSSTHTFTVLILQDVTR